MPKRPAKLESLQHEWFRRVWCEMDSDAIDELFAKDGVARGIYGADIRGPAAFKEFHAAFQATFSDIHIEVIEEMETSVGSAFRAGGTMVHRAAGKKGPLTGCGFARVRNRQLLDVWNCWDFLGFLESIDHMPKDSFAPAVSGKMEKHPLA